MKMFYLSICLRIIANRKLKTMQKLTSSLYAINYYIYCCFTLIKLNELNIKLQAIVQELLYIMFYTYQW